MLNASEARSMMPDPTSERRKLMAMLTCKIDQRIAEAAKAGAFRVRVVREDHLIGLRATSEAEYIAVMIEIVSILRGQQFGVDTNSTFDRLTISWREKGG
jgi:hypothetical protein